MDKQQAMEYHDKLSQEGWLRRFTAEGPRLWEMKQFYESLGLEVLVVEGATDARSECSACFDVEGYGSRYKTLYTRGVPMAEPGPDDDLFD